MSKFVPGNSYQTRMICDSRAIVAITVARRTAKMIQTTDGKHLRIFMYEGVECVKPLGSYSMCPVIRAA